MNIGVGTCIVGLVTSDEIVIGADSLRSYQDREPDFICKIVQAGKIFFASSGLNLSEDDNFDVHKLCKEAVSRSKSIAETVDRLQELIEEPLKKIYQRAAKDEAEYYQSVLKENPVGVAFFGIEDEQLILHSRIFKPDESSGEIKLNIVDQNFIRDQVQEPSYISMACSSAVYLAIMEAGWNRRIVVPDPNKDKQGYVKYMIDWAMERESVPEGHKKLIGGPISILQLNKNGAQWLQNELGCPDIE